MGLERYLLIAAFWMIPVFGTFDWTRGPNCYVFTGKNQNGVDVDGLYIPVKKAYDMWANGGEFMVNDNGSYTPITDGTAAAGLYWEDAVGLITLVSLEGTGKDAKIKVLVDRLKEGNAVISYKVNEIIYWTWHVWVTDDPTNGSTHHHGFEKDQFGNLVTDWRWMDRNLGATNEKLTGHNWYKTKGLQYAWGRKDPFPVNKIRGEAGIFVPGIAQKPVIPVKFRGNVQPPDANGISHNTGFDTANGNIRYTINNPIHLVVPPVYIYKIGETVVDNGENFYKQGPNPYKWALGDVTAWFSKKKMRNYDKNDFKKTVFWDLWGDTRGGKWSNFNTRVLDIAEESKRYSMKSPYDPCPHGWRVPSYYSSVNSEQAASPWGKKGKPAMSEFNPDTPSADYPGIKIYPSLGFDLTGVSDRNLGYIPVNGNYEYYPQGMTLGDGAKVNRNNEKLFLGFYADKTGPTVLLQDQLTDGGLHSSTMNTEGLLGDLVSKGYGFVCDAGNVPGHSSVGWYYLASTSYSQGGVRCIKDPNNAYMPKEFETEYVPSTPTDVYTLDELKNWTKDPNCYIEYTNSTLATPNAAAKDRVIEIPLRKAYAMHKLHYSVSNDFPTGDVKSSSVVWTTDRMLIAKLTIVDGSMDTAKLRVVLNENCFGNAVVAFHLGKTGWMADKNPDPIIWSWHIWAPESVVEDYPTFRTETYANNGIKPDTSGQFVNPVYSYYGYPMNTTFMDRDLGAQIPFFDQHFEADHMNFYYSPVAPTSESSLRVMTIKRMGSLHYQWGRKDPIPVFYYPGGFFEHKAGGTGTARDNFRRYTVYKQTGLNNGDIVYGATIDETKYLADYSKEYSTYSSGITASDPLYVKIKKTLKYSVNNPFTYLYQNVSSTSTDWISDENGLFEERWGAESEKSPYDPCPEGYRIPDLMMRAVEGVNLFDGYHPFSKGNSPWFYNARFSINNKTYYGIDPTNFNTIVNNEPYNVNKMDYVGGYVRSTGAGRPQTRYGFVMNRPEYNIGNFPNNAIRGWNGGNVIQDWLRSGIWTSAALREYAFGVLFNAEITQNKGPNQKIYFFTPSFTHRPQSAMSCRCAKIEYDVNGKEIGRYDPSKY